MGYCPLGRHASGMRAEWMNSIIKCTYIAYQEQLYFIDTNVASILGRDEDILMRHSCPCY